MGDFLPHYLGEPFRTRGPRRVSEQIFDVFCERIGLRIISDGLDKYSDLPQPFQFWEFMQGVAYPFVAAVWKQSPRLQYRFDREIVLSQLFVFGCFSPFYGGNIFIHP